MSFDFDVSANRLKQTYFKGFVDISGNGGVRLRNDISINFFDTTNSTVPKFSIKSDSMRITDNIGTKYDISNSQLLLIRDLSQNAQAQFNDLFSRTMSIKSGTADIDTMMLMNKNSQTIEVTANIIPSRGGVFDLGSPSRPFHSLYVNQGTVHFIRENGEQLVASLSYNTNTGDLDLSAGGFSTPLNNTRYINGKLSTPLMSYNGNVGIGTNTPSAALDISGQVVVRGSTIFNGSLTIMSGDVSMNGRLITNGVLENGVALSEKYASIDSPVLNGNVEMKSVRVSENMKIEGDLSLNGKLFAGDDALFKNLFVTGNLISPTPSVSENSTLVATTAFVKNQNYAPIANSSLTGTTNIVNVNVSQKMTVTGDVSMNSKLSVYSGTTLQNTLSVAGITTLNNKLIVLGDASINGNILLQSPSQNDNSSRAATTAFVQTQGYAKLSGAVYSGDISLNANLSVAGTSRLNGSVYLNGDASINGNLYAQTQSNTDNSTRVATTAFVQNQGYATLSSPAFTGNVKLPLAAITDLLVFGNTTFYNNANVLTQITNDNSTLIASTAFVKNQGYATLASPAFVGSVSIPTANISNKLVVDGNTVLNGNVTMTNETRFTANVFAETPALNNSSNLIATTAFVKNQMYAELNGANFTGTVSTTRDLSVAGNTVFGNNITVNGATFLNGVTRSVTQANDDNSTKIATTAFVKSQAYATLSSPAFVGFPTAPTPSIGTSNAQLATTEYVRNEVTSFINSIPSAFDAIQQLSTALSSTDASFATTLVTSLGLKADVKNPTFNGIVSIPTASITETLSVYGDVSFNNNFFVNGDISANGQIHTVTPFNNENSTLVATTAYVKNQGYATLSGANFTGDVTTTRDITVGKSVSVIDTLSVGGNTSLNKNMKVVGNVVIGKSLTISQNFLLAGDASMNGNVNIGGSVNVPTPMTSDNSTLIATTAYVQNQGFAKLTGAIFTGGIETTSNLSVGGEVSMTGNIVINGRMYLQNQLFVTEDVSLNKNLRVGGKIYENGNELSTTYATLHSPAFTGTISGITQSMVGLSNIDNTSDINKPISTLTQNVLNTKLNIVNPDIIGNVMVSGSLTVVDANMQTLNVNKNITVLQDASLCRNVSVSNNLHVVGNLYTNTQDNSDISKRVATTEFVKNQNYAKLSGATFIGNVTVNNELVVNSNTSIQNNLSVLRDTQLNGNLLVNGNTAFTGEVTLNNNILISKNASINGNLILSGDASMNGNIFVNGAIQLPTQPSDDNSNKVATTAFVKNQEFAKLSGAKFIGDVSFNKSMMVSGKTTLQNDTIITGDTSMNSHLFVGSDVSLNAKLYTKGDAVFGNTITIMKDVIVSNNIIIGNNTRIGGALVVLSDTSLNGNLNIGGTLNAVTQSVTDASTKVATTAFVKNQNYATIESPIFTGTVNIPSAVISQNLAVNADTYFYDNLYVTNNTSVGGNLTVSKSIITTTPATNENSTMVATTAYVKNQNFAPISSPSFLGNVSVANNLTILGNTNLSGVTTSITPETTDNSSKVATTAFVKSQLFAPLASPTLTGTTTISTIDVSKEASIGGNLVVLKTIYEKGAPLSATYATLASPTFTGIVGGITKSMIELGNVDNTADINKPVSLLQESALNLKSNLNSPAFTGVSTMETLYISTNLMVLGNASISGFLNASTPLTSDNSTRVATTAYVNNKGFARLTGAAFTGAVSTTSDLSVFGNVLLNGTSTAVTQVSSDNSAKIATTAYVKSQGFAYLSSPTFVGYPTAPTADISASTTDQIATTKYVEGKISAFFNVASTETLNAINAVSQAMANVNSDTTTALTSALNLKADLESPTFTGTVSVNNLSVSQGFSVVGDGSFNGEVRAGRTIYENGIPLEQRYATLSSPTFTGTVFGITKSMVGLSNVENTADMEKPISTATQITLNQKANLESPEFTGITKALRFDVSTDSSLNGNLFVGGKLYENGQALNQTYAKLVGPTFTGVVRGIDASMVGLNNVNNTSDLNKPVSIAQANALSLKANLVSPVFSGITVMADASMNGNVTAPTPNKEDSSNRVATTAYVKSQNQSNAQLTGAVFTGDISLNARLSVAGDTSLNQNVYVGKDLVVTGNITGNYRGNSIPLSAIIGGLGASVDLSTNQTIYGKKTFAENVTTSAELNVVGNVMLASSNIISTTYQSATEASYNTISNLTKITNNYNGTFIHNFEISKENGSTLAYSTVTGIPVVSIDGGNNWKSMSLISPNTSFQGMLCISPDGRVRIQQEIVGTTPSLYVSIDWGVTYNPVSITHPFIYNNAFYGYNTYNDQAYAFSHDGTILYLIARDINNTIVIWKNTDATFTSFTRQNQSWNYTLNNAPRAIATSNDGTYVLTITGIVPNNGYYLSVSNNGGASFTRTVGSINTNWNAIAVSYSGKYQTATNNNSIYQSNDFGVSWSVSTAPVGLNWTSIHMSNDGKNRVVTISKGYQYISLDYGISWQKIPNSYGNWKKSIMTDMSNNNSINIFSHDGINIFKNTYLSADTQQTTTMNSNLNIVSPYFYMNNMGKMTKVVKTENFNNDTGRYSGISSTGQYIIIPLANKQTILSQDYGETWAPLAGLTSQTNYTSATVSGNGKYMFVRNGATSYFSINYGVSWSPFTTISLTDSGNGTALSETGQYMVYAGKDSANISSVYVSANYGSSWELKSTFSTTNTVFGAAISDSGQYMAVFSSVDKLLVSNDYGMTWVGKSLNSCRSISISLSGQYQTVISTTGIYSSKDYGYSFVCTSMDAAGNNTSITMDGTGHYQYVVNSNISSGLYVSSDFGSSWSFHTPNTLQAPSNSIISRNGKVMLYGATGDICISRVANNVGSISETALSISKEGIKSALDLTVNGAIHTQTLVVNSIYENGNLLGSKYATISNPSFTGNVSGITKTMVGLGNIDNTADAVKPISAFAQAALNLKSNIDSPIFTGIISMPNLNISQNITVIKDSSFGGNMLVARDLTVVGNLYATYAENTIPPKAIIGGLPGATGVFDYDISANTNLYVGHDTSLNQNLFVGKETILKGRLFVSSDSLLNGNLNVNGNVIFDRNMSIGSKLTVIDDTSMNRNLSVGGDVSLNGKLLCGSEIYENGKSLTSTYAKIEYPSFVGTATFDKITGADLAISNNTVLTGQLNVKSGAEFETNIRVNGQIYENDVALISKYATIHSPAFTGTVAGITKTMVGLSAVDNTSDINKPVSTAQQTALNFKSDIASPIFTGIPQAPTATTGTNTSQIATTSFVCGEISNLIGAAPSTLNTLYELSQAINVDASFASTIATTIGLKAPLESPVFSGTVSLPTTNISKKLNVTEDTFLNNRLFVGGNLNTLGDASFNSKVHVGGNILVDGFITAQYPSRSIPSSAIDNIANQYGKLMFQAQRNDLVTYDDEHFATYESAGAVPFLETLYAYDSDLSLNGHLYIHGTGVSIFNSDMSFNKELRVNSNIYEGGVTLSNKYASLSSASFTGNVNMPNLYLPGDISLNGDLYVGNTIFEKGLSLGSVYSNLASPTFTGVPSAPTPTTGTNTTQIATTEFVHTGIDNLVESAPSNLNTLNKLALSIGNDSSFSTTVTGQINLKAPMNNPTFTGVVAVSSLSSTGNVNMNMNLNVDGEVMLGNSLDISGSIIAHDNLNIYGIINQYTLSLEDGNKVSFDTGSQISLLQSQVSALQNQLASVLQILTNHNLM